MSRREAAATRRPELWNMRCIIVTDLGYNGVADAQYWRHPAGSELTLNMDEALEMSLSEALAIIGVSNIAFITEPEPGPDGNPRLRQAKLLLGHSLYAMVEASPNNPTVRAHIMAKCGEMPKDELDTAQKIIDWVECDLKLPDKNAAVAVNHPDAIDWAALEGPPATRGAPRTEPPPAFVVETENTEVERGTCLYSVTEHTTSSVPITTARIEQLIDPDEDLDMEEILDRLASDVDEDARNNPTGHHYTDEETNNREPSDGDGMESDFSRATLKQQLIEYLRRTQTPELLRSLGINE